MANGAQAGAKWSEDDESGLAVERPGEAKIISDLRYTRTASY